MKEPTSEDNGATEREQKGETAVDISKREESEREMNDSAPLNQENDQTVTSAANQEHLESGLEAEHEVEEAENDAEESPPDTFDAESDVLETPGELQHGATIQVSVAGSNPQHNNNTTETENDDSTIPLSRQPEIIVGEEEQSVDLSSVGMGSVVSQQQWEDHHAMPLMMMMKRSQQRRHYTWNPSSARGRSRRWDAHPALAAITPVAQASPRQTAPDVLQEAVGDVEAPLQNDESTSTDEHIIKSSSQSALCEESSDAKTDGEATTAPPSVASPYTLLGAPDSKFECYHCVVDSSQEDRAVEIQLSSMARPHMRAFHLAWMAFFVAFFTWFALTPLLSEIAISLHLNKEEIWTSSIFGVAGSAVTRIFIGPICDKYGSRWAMGGTLFLSAIPMALTGLVQTGVGLSILRLFIGLAGSSFVTCQYWTSSMFTREVAGTANAVVAGWGNLGGGVAQIVMGSLVFPLLKIIYGGDGWSRAESDSDDDSETAYDRASDLAWRTSCVVPALMCFTMTYFVIRKADDCPKGNYTKRNREGLMPSVSARKSVISGMRNFNTWILFIQYGCCFGAEITMTNAAALYFKDEFGLSTELSAAVASIFGWMNLFARGLGGFLSDIFNAKLGMRGRLWVQAVTLLAEGAFVIVFSKTHTLGGAIVVMIAFSCFVQAAEGSTYGIVPYVNPQVTGSISGIVGAGGNVGGVIFATIFREYDYRHSFSIMGWTAMISAICTVPISISGHASLFCGSDAPEVLERRCAHTEEMGHIPSVLLQQDPDQSRRSSVVDRDTSRRSRMSVPQDDSRQSRQSHQHGT